MLMVSPAFATDKSGDMACCAKTASGQSCLNLATLNLNADQKAKLEAWQGGVHESRVYQRRSRQFHEAGERNPISRSVCETERAVSQVGEEGRSVV
jgi:hypothetical protein